jgi:hypothetical protein
MSNQAESNYFSPILSALAGVGAIVASFSPLFINKIGIEKIFIDSSVISFASVISLLTVILSIWLMSSVRSFGIFKNYQNQEVIKLRFIIFFIIFSVIFYSSNLFAKNNIINKDFASIIQLTSYILAFFSLGSSVGLILRDSYQAFKFQKIEETKLDRTKEAIIKSGLVNVDLEILSLTKHTYVNGEPIDMITSNEVIFKTNNKTYRGILSNDYSYLLVCGEIKEK